MPRSLSSGSRTRSVILLASVGAAAVVVGCATLIGADGSRTLLDTDAASPSFVDVGDAIAVVPDAGDPNACPAGQKRCNGACVHKSDPQYGCAATECSPCSVPNADVVKCTDDGECSWGTCKAGFIPCGSPSAGCQTDILALTTCGSCGHMCAPAAYCNPGGNCNDKCDDNLTDCAHSCVDTLTNPLHCGAAADPTTACTNVCPGATNGDPACISGKCSLACRAGFGLCNGGTACAQLHAFYRDADGDSYGDVTQSKFACDAKDAGLGWVAQAGDCNDGDPNVHPGQKNFFSSPYKRANGTLSFDYDCDGVEVETAGVVHFTACAEDCRANTGIGPLKGRSGAGVNDYCGSVEELSCATADMTPISSGGAASNPRLHFSGLTPQDSPINTPPCGVVSKAIPPNLCH